MKNHTTKAIACTSCGANSFRLVLIIRDDNRNLLRAYCNKCGAARDTAVGKGRAVDKGPSRRKNKEELL